MLPELPNELLGQILSHLVIEIGITIDRLRDISQARLVCRQWNEVATKYLFRTVKLWPTEYTIKEDFQNWHKTIDLAAAKDAARRVVIHSAQEDDDGGCYYDWWPESWEDHGEWPEFEDAINKIRKLSNIRTIEILFTGCCAGQDANREPWAPRLEIAEPETINTRFQTLRFIMEAMHQRAARLNSVIRELVLENIQNVPLPQDISDSLFKNIQQLHLKILSEDYGRQIENKERLELIDRPELREFPHYLQNTLLPSVADQLVELTLAGKHWGGIPGEFNGRGLSFPKLKILTLDGFDLLRQDQFDWVLDQKSLAGLHLYNCTIASHCCVEQPKFANWNVNLRGWKSDDGWYLAQRVDPGRRLQRGWYANPLRWDTVFNSIHEKLPGLQYFSFDKKPWSAYFRHDTQGRFAGQMELRYLAFSGRWFEPPRRHYYERSKLQESMPWSAEDLDKNEHTDLQALKKLVQIVEARRNGN